MSLEVPATAIDIKSKTGDIRWRWIIAYSTLFVCIGFLLLFNLGNYPAPHYDEGAYLKVAKSFALHGVYANYGRTGYSYLGPVVSTGPTLILPIALLFKLFGTSIVLGRLVVVGYALLMLAMIFGLARRLFNTRLALFTVICTLLTLAVVNNIRVVRTAIGEVPGMFFVFAGLYLWLVPKKVTLVHLVGVGVCFGLAGITKNQYLLVIGPAMLLSFALDLFWHRRRRWAYFIVPGIITLALYGAWNYYVLFMLGAGVRDVAHDLATLRSQTSAWLFQGESINTNLDNLFHDNSLYLAGLIYGAVLALRRDEELKPWGILFTFLVSSSGMYVFSISEARYEVPVQFLTILFMIRLIRELAAGVQVRTDIRRIFQGQPISAGAVGLIVGLGLIVSLYGRPALLRFRELLASDNGTLYQTVQYLNANVPKDKIIFSWDEEVAVLSDHTFDYPPIDYPFNPDLEPDRTPVPDYILIGSMTGQWGENYLKTRLPDFKLIYSNEGYKLYQHQ